MEELSVLRSVLLLLFLLLTGIASAEIKLGTIPRHNSAEVQAMFSPLAEYLSREVGEKVTVIVPKDFDAFKDAVQAGLIENPLIYIQVKDKVNIEPLALSSEVKGGTRLRGIIIVRKDSAITTVQELLPVSMKPEQVAMAVLDKTADAGAMREDDLDKMKDKMDISRLRVVGYTDYFPNWPVFAAPIFKKEKAEKIRAALLKLKPSDPQYENIVAPARLTGFVPVSDKEYDDLRSAARVAGAM